MQVLQGMQALTPPGIAHCRSAEPHDGSTLVVSLFEIDASGDAIPAFIEREHEFRFMAVAPIELKSDASIGAHRQKRRDHVGI